MNATIASTFLGSRGFIEWIQINYLQKDNIDQRNIPAIKQLKSVPSFESIEKLVGDIIQKEDPLYNKICVYIAQNHVGFSLKEIGRYNNMKESAISQSNRRLKQRLNYDKKLRKIIKKVRMHVNMSNNET